MSFAEIVRYVPIEDMIALYQPYYEMDIHQFVDKVNAMCKEAKSETTLKLLRQKADLSQRKLAALSGVTVCTIQQYEQRQKNINKARMGYLIVLAKIRCCEVGGLMKKKE
ncbi:helix-turn-helix domain-containing protein [Lacrimispora sp. NSJ-141]|uniref:Helix-turn-helix domain-containing protein n=1 Tax=Lientehia hominis TaxID=2897778 RepID=A0AAP2RI58_9FIRM|nr:helix-turn-helix transcriptional regulator [Lientehia hominis]MCD2491763.1 helix-turn-helix domain-containing protein [Lientehia hominis]